MQLSSFLNIICWRDCLFPIVYSCLLCQRLFLHRCVSLFLGSLFCFIDLYVCMPIACSFDYCSFVVLPEVWEGYASRFVLFFFFNFIFFLNFTILYWFCQISKWIRHRYTCVPHPEPSSLLPPHSIPLGRPSAPAPSIQYSALNLDWQLVSYM